MTEAMLLTFFGTVLVGFHGALLLLHGVTWWHPIWRDTDAPQVLTSVAWLAAGLGLLWAAQ